jgi:hypothetical protein
MRTGGYTRTDIDGNTETVSVTAPEERNAVTNQRVRSDADRRKDKGMTVQAPAKMPAEKPETSTAETASTAETTNTTEPTSTVEKTNTSKSDSAKNK